MTRVGQLAQAAAIAIGALIVLFILVETVDVARSTPSTPVPTVRPAVGPASGCRPAPCGDANGFELFVNRVDRPRPGLAIFGTAGSTQYVSLQVSFANHTNDPLAVNPGNRADPADFKLRDSLGVEHEASFTVAPGCARWSATEVNRSANFGPEPLCFETTGELTAPVTLIWSPDVGFLSRDVEILLP